MNDDQDKLLSLKAAYVFGNAHGLEKEISEIREMTIEWDRSYTSSLRRGYIVALFEKHGLFDTFKNEHWKFGHTPPGERTRQRFLRIRDDYEAFLSGRAPDDIGDRVVEDPSGLGAEEALEFALEAHLRDFLAKNMERIEPGLRLYVAADRNGIEFAIDGGRIDILAVDKNNQFVVVELKLSQGRNKTLGQLLYYMGWVDKNLGGGPCRGYIIANEMDGELCIAVSRVPGVSLARYRMSFAIDAV